MVTGHARRLGCLEPTSSVIVQEDMSEKHVRSHRQPAIWLSPAGMEASAAAAQRVTLITTVFVLSGRLGNYVQCFPNHRLW